MNPPNSTIPKVSVIVAVYNQETYIGRCLRSLLNQTMPHSDYEIIIVDDGSFDRTPYALDLFCDTSDSLVRVITNEFNMGLPSAINLGLNTARAPYVVRVDSDDYVNVNFLNILSYCLDSNPHFDAVACDYLLVDDKEFELGRFSCASEPIACGIIFRKEHLFDIGLYDEDFLRCEDRELRYRFEMKYKIRSIELPLYRYRRHSSNITNDPLVMARFNEMMILKHGLSGGS